MVALHTGPKTTPLLEMLTDCRRPHPKDGAEFLVLYKRRGHSTTKVALRANSTVGRLVASTPMLRPTVAQLIRRGNDLTSVCAARRLVTFATGSGYIGPGLKTHRAAESCR